MRNIRFTEERKAYFKGLLRHTLDQLVKETGTPPAGMNNLEHKASDLIDQASIETDNTLNLCIRERGGRLAEKIADALRRLEDGTFGICEECRRPISGERLKVRPIASLCIKCKEKEEVQEKRRGL